MLAVISQRFFRSGDLPITPRADSITTPGRLAHWKNIRNKKNPGEPKLPGFCHIHRDRSRAGHAYILSIIT